MKQLGPIKYNIEGTTIQMWEADAPEDALPFMYQPIHPVTMEPFNSTEEAEQWAIEYITNIYL